MRVVGPAQAPGKPPLLYGTAAAGSKPGRPGLVLWGLSRGGHRLPGRGELIGLVAGHEPRESEHPHVVPARRTRRRSGGSSLACTASRRLAPSLAQHDCRHPAAQHLNSGRRRVLPRPSLGEAARAHAQPGAAGALQAGPGQQTGGRRCCGHSSQCVPGGGHAGSLRRPGSCTVAKTVRSHLPTPLFSHSDHPEICRLTRLP